MTRDRRTSTEKSWYASLLGVIGSVLWWTGVLAGWAVLGCFVGLLALSASTHARCAVLAQVSLCTSAFGHS